MYVYYDTIKLLLLLIVKKKNDLKIVDKPPEGGAQEIRRAPLYSICLFV